MPHFSESGHDEVLCQGCGRIVDTGKETVTWVRGKGNHCPSCAPGERPMSLHEHAKIESGGLTGAALDRYIHRYYGHG